MYNASDLISGTWANVSGPAATWISSQNSDMRGFTIFVDGYGIEMVGEVFCMKTITIMNGDMYLRILI